MFTTTWEPNYVNKVEEVELVEKVEVYPNPSNGRFELVIQGSEGAGVVISDISGRIIVNEKLSATSGTVRKTYDLTGQPKGTYVIRTDAAGKTETRRIIIN
jgi:hypothetical protein